MKSIRKITALLALLTAIIMQVTTAYASTHVHPGFYLNGHFQVPNSAGSHTVTVNVYDPKWGGYIDKEMTCSMTQIYDVYEYRCHTCPYTYTTQNKSPIVHSLSH